MVDASYMGERAFPELMNWPSFCFLIIYWLHLEKAVATRFGILAWGIPRAAEPGELLSLGSQGVGHGRATTAHTRTHWHHRGLAGFPWCLRGKESAPFLRPAPRPCRRHELDPWVAKMPWRSKWQIYQSTEDSSVNSYTSITNVIDDQHALSVFVCPQLLGF